MSSPIDFNKNGGSQGPGAGQGGSPGQGAPQGYAPQGAPQGFAPAGGPPNGFVPGQVGRGLDSAAPTEARLPKGLGEEGKNTPMGFGRLVSVELRKQIDTRAGKWLIGVTVALVLLISALVAYNSDGNPHFVNFMAASAIPLSYLLPILGIMAVTSEWSQRTGLVTFSLEPRRSRVILAKWAAASVLAIGATLVAFAAGALFTLLAAALGGGEADWNLDTAAYGTIPLMMLLQVSMGVGFGLVLQNTPGAICAFLFIPVAVSMLGLFDWARTVLEWINPSETLNALGNGHVSGEDWAKVAVSVALWVGVPMVLGFMRLHRREVK